MSEQQHPTPTDDDDSVADDKLRGAIKIGAEINEPPHRVYRLFSLGRLKGVYKDGRDLIGSKRALRRAHHNRARTGKCLPSRFAQCMRVRPPAVTQGCPASGPGGADGRPVLEDGRRGATSLRSLGWCRRGVHRRCRGCVIQTFGGVRESAALFLETGP
jgi:hypothetical protein